MKKYLALTLLLSALLSLSDAFCVRKREEPGATHCQDHVDKTWHPVGSHWRNSECLDCDCNECCSAYSTPKQFPEDCVSVFDSATCEYIVHKRDDPSVHCPIYASVGK